jgi:hypothetical protein
MYFSCAWEAGLFLGGSTEADGDTPGGHMPAHGGTGQFWHPQGNAGGLGGAFGRGALGGLRDPGGHSVELATPGLWTNY